MVSHVEGADLAWAATFNGEPTSTTCGFRRYRARSPIAKIEVFDTAGRRVTTLVDGYLKGGAQSVRWAGTDDSGRVMRSGVYLCRVQGAGSAQTVKFMQVR